MGNYKKLIFLFLVTVFGGNSLVMGQVKIGGNPSVINVNSALEIETSDKGLLLPRITLVSTTSASPLTNAIVAGMTVYNTATNGDVTPGFYYYNGAKWIRVADAAAGTVTASNGLSVSSNDVKLGGALVSPTTITTDAANTFALAGLQTGLVTDDVVLSSGGVMKKIDATSFISGLTTVSNTTSANNLSTTVNGVTGTVVPMINSNVVTNTKGNLETTVNGVASASVPVLISSSNGLVVADGDVKLGGALTSPTTITTDATNTFTLVGLQPGAITDDIITANAAGILTRTPKSAVPNIYTADGTLTGPRILTQGGNKLTFLGSVANGSKTDFFNDDFGSTISMRSTSARTGLNLRSGTAALFSFIDPDSEAQIITNGVATGLRLGTGGAFPLNLISGGTTRMSLDGGTGEVNVSNNMVIDASGMADTSGLRLNHLNAGSPEVAGGAIGVDNSGNVVRIPVLSSSSNGLTTTNGDAKLGGILTSPTTIITDATNTLNLSGLQTGLATDDIITADATTGVLTKSAKSSLPNIYTTDGTLTANRTVLLEDKFLRFDGEKGSISFDNYNQGSLSVIGKAVSPDLRAASFDLRAGATSLTSAVNEGSFAQITANGAAGLSISTIGAAGLSFSTNSQGRMSISDTGLVGVTNSVEINNVSGANDTSGLKLAKLKSTSPESNGGAIGVDNGGNVVRIGSANNSFSDKTGNPIVIGAVTTAPTKGVSQNDFIRYRDIGNNQIEVDFMYSSALSAGAVNGAGDYLFSLPIGYNFNGGENPWYSGVINGPADLNAALPYALRDVKAVFIGSGGTSTAAYVIPYSATQFRLVGVSTGLPVSDTYNGIAGTTAVYGGRFIFVKQ